VAPPDKAGLAARTLRDYARQRGAAAFLLRGELADLETELALRRPVIVGIVSTKGRQRRTHYEVVVGLHHDRGLVATLDPARGLRQSSLADFFEEWEPSRRLALVVMSPQAARAARAPERVLPALHAEVQR
jgi:hypothetical protein